MSDILSLKEEANGSFKIGNFPEAIQISLKALSLCTDDTNLKCTLHKNIAASYLKLNQFDETLLHCNKALEISPQDPKALFRKASALEGLERYEEAYQDAQRALMSSPSDAKFFTPLLSRLHPIVQKERSQLSQIEKKASRMISLAFDSSSSEEDRETGLNNVLVLCRERAGLTVLLQQGLLLKLKTLLELRTSSLPDLNRKIMALRTLAEACRFGLDKCQQIIKELGVPFFVNLQDIAQPISSNKELVEQILTPLRYLWQAIIDTLSGTKKNEKPNSEMLKNNQPVIDSFLNSLSNSINSRSILPEARDIILQLFIKIIDVNSISWGEQFLDSESEAFDRLLDLACEIPQANSESDIGLTTNTKNLTSILLGRIYDNLYSDAPRTRYVDSVDNYIKNLLMEPSFDAKLKCITLLTSLLVGPIDVGNSLLGKHGILQMILVMANSDNYLQQRIASEAIVAAASKKDKAKGIISEGINILKRLYQSKREDIKVRALVGLCKLGSTGGTDASWKPFDDGGNIKLAEACLRFLAKPTTDLSIKRWAIEGLSYLTLDAEVKERLVEDQTALNSLLEISKYAGQMGEIVYPVITCMVNLVNAYDKQELVPEMVELAKFAKHHIPEEHEYDDPDFVDKRVEALVNLGITASLVNLSKATESKNQLELIARILNSICEKDTHRGKVVAGGGARELIRISKKATDKGQKLAAQALARIGISQPPSVAFPGQRSYEVVRPLLSILHIDCPALQNFEALLALCNLAGESESLRQRIIEGEGFSKIENYIYEDHQLLKRAALQCLVNLVMSERVVEKFEGENDRVKYMVLLSSAPDDLDENDKEEIEIMKAASAVLAVVSSGNEKICGRILTCVKNSMEILIWLVANPLIDLQIRGITIVRNILEANEELAEQIVKSPAFELLMAISQTDLTKETDTSEIAAQRKDVKKRCTEALGFAEKWKLIEKN